MYVRIISPCEVQTWVEGLATVLCESLAAKGKPSVHKLHVGSFSEGVVHHRLVLVHRDGAGRVDKISTRFGFGTHAVDGAKDELLLKMGEEGEVAIRL